MAWRMWSNSIFLSPRNVQVSSYLVGGLAYPAISLLFLPISCLKCDPDILIIIMHVYTKKLSSLSKELVYLRPRRLQFCCTYDICVGCVLYMISRAVMRCTLPKAGLRVTQPRFTLQRLCKHEGAAGKNLLQPDMAHLRGFSLAGNTCRVKT